MTFLQRFHVRSKPATLILSNRGTINKTIIAVLIVVAVFLGAIILAISGDGPEKQASMSPSIDPAPNKIETVIETEETANPISQDIAPEKPVDVKPISESERMFAKAKEALRGGDTEGAEDFAYQAILQTLRSSKALMEGSSPGNEGYEKGKEEVVQELKEMWRFYGEIGEVPETVSSAKPGEIDVEGDDDLGPSEPSPSESPEPSEPECEHERLGLFCGKNICQWNDWCRSDFEGCVAALLNCEDFRRPDPESP